YIPPKSLIHIVELDSYINTIESLNSVIRHAIKKRKVFPSDDSVPKVIYLAIESTSKKWSMPIKS
ncbi:transposase, partial [Providencia rettgeri]